MERIRIIDSHTGGEPTRIVIDDPLPLLCRLLGREMEPEPRSPLAIAERISRFGAGYDALRRAVCGEPRGSDVLVGGVLCEPSDPSCAAGVIFFNNVGLLNMCGHATIGLATTLAHLGRISSGVHRVETRAGIVSFTLREDGSISLENVPSYRRAAGVRVEVPGHGVVTGDIAWGGNWFFLCEDHGLHLGLDRVEELTAFAWRMRQVVNAMGFPEVDHVELFGPASIPGSGSRNFVLCPGRAYDRSACGTGTSAKLACLAADGKLAEGAVWTQESIIGSTFAGSYRWSDRTSGIIIPTISGTAYLTAEAEVLLDPRDPYCWGIGASAPGVP